MTELSPIAQKIFKMKYAVNDKETWEQACFRVASYIASTESNFGKDQESIDEITKNFFQLIYNLVLLPGGRVIANSGTSIKNLKNCFVLPIGDSRKSIYNTLQTAAEIFALGGGCGFNFSHIREEGALIKGTGGSASGPLSFMTVFDQTGEIIQQASRR